MNNRLRRIWWAGWFGAITVLAAGVVVYVVTRESGAETPGAAASRVSPRRLPARPPRPCAMLVAGPTKLYACNDGHGWTRHGLVWTDAGPLTPGPMVPKS